MGKGDRRTKRGKIWNGSYGKFRPRKKVKKEQPEQVEPEKQVEEQTPEEQEPETSQTEEE